MTELEEKLVECFDEMAVFKDLKQSNFFSDLKLPSFLRDWVLKKFEDSEGQFDIEEIMALAASEVLRGTLHYLVDENGFTVSQGEESANLPWDQIYKMVATKSNVLVYSTRINAYIIPREQLGEQYKDLAKIANEKLPKHRVKMQ